jgi:hypothetical protein
MTQSLKSIKATAIVTATASITSSTNIGGNLLPTANVTYDIGSSTARWKDIYLSNNTIYLGNTAVSANSILPINLDIAPEVLTINVAAPAAGDDTQWLWNWQTSTLPYARTTIVNSAQVSVPLYKQGTYQINNFANEQTGVMTQRHGAHLKWVDGAGLDNLVSWAVESGNVSMANVNINNNATTNVQRINVSVPASVTVPTLTAPNISSYMTVSCVNAGVYTFDGNGDGDNRTLGPLYRGGTYTFILASSLSNDPFYFTTDNGTNWTIDGYYGEYTTGVTGSRNNGTTGKTTIKIIVDSNAPDVLFYQSAKTASKRGAIIIKDLAVETNINGNYVLYFQHSGEGHKTPVEIRPIPSLVNQMCVVYDASVGKFVPQDLATYVENTPSFKNKIREVAGTATLIAPNGVAVVPTVLIVEDTTYLPLINNKEGDIAFDAYYDTMYVWQGNAWRNTKPTSVATVTTNAQPNITSVGTLTDLSVSGNATITGNLTVSGTTTTINSTTVTVNDVNLVLANNASTAAQANGAGITINGASAIMNYISGSNAFTFSHKIVADGSLLTSLTGANVTGTVANATYATSAGSANSVSAGNISGTINLANYATTANSVAVANVSGIGNIATINKDGNASNILYGNGTFAAAPSAGTNYANGNVATFLASFGSNTISTTGNITSGNANLGNAVTANYHIGNLYGTANLATYATTANSVALANVSGIGNIASINKDGNASNILYGNGVFAAAPSGATYGNSNVATFLGSYGSNTITTTGNVSVGNIIGNGQALTGLAGANVSGQVGNALVAGTVYTAAQGNITSVGSLTGLTVSNATGVVNFSNTANVTLGAVANLHISGGSSGQFLKTDGAGTLSWAAASGGSSNAYRTMEYWDTLVVFNGSKRWYATSSFTISSVSAFLVTAPTGSSAIFRVNKNGTSAATVTITASSTSVTSSINISMVSGDYITVDITQIGSSTAGAFLSMVFTYQ